MKIEEYLGSLPQNIMTGRDVQLPDRAFRDIFELAKMGSGDVFYHLGCGDGRGLEIARREFNAKRVVGIDSDRGENGGRKRQGAGRRGDNLRRRQEPGVSRRDRDPVLVCRRRDRGGGGGKVPERAARLQDNNDLGSPTGLQARPGVVPLHPPRNAAYEICGRRRAGSCGLWDKVHRFYNRVEAFGDVHQGDRQRGNAERQVSDHHPVGGSLDQREKSRKSRATIPERTAAGGTCPNPSGHTSPYSGSFSASRWSTLLKKNGV